MSTEEQNIQQIPPGLLSNRTIAQSITGEGRDRRLEPEDMRARRFGYNPGLIMPADPIWSGLQTQVVPRGVLVLFETATVSRQKHSVDKDDRTPPNEYIDFLAGEGLGNVFHQYGAKGFREIRPLRGNSDVQAATLFNVIHPRWRDCVEFGVIEPCMYGPKECLCDNQGECEYCTYVCITCRSNALSKLTAVPDAARGLLSIVRESVALGRAEMFNTWRTAVGEVASWNGGKSVEMALKQLTEDHLFFMRQLHQRTPQDQDLARYELQQKAQAEQQQAMLNQQRELITASLKIRGASQDNAETAELKARLADLEGMVKRLTEPATATDETGDTPAK